MFKYELYFSYIYTCEKINVFNSEKHIKTFKGRIKNS